jgi:ketosteroid isomerase-like protein
MSQENVEIMRRDHEAFDRGDFAAFLDDCHPAIDWTDSFEEFSQVAEEFTDAGDLYDNEAEALEAAGLSE